MSLQQWLSMPTSAPGTASHHPWLAALTLLLATSGGVASLAQSAASLPAPAVPPSTALTAAPATFWCSQPVGPGETVVLSAANLDATSYVVVARLDDLDPGSPVVPARQTSVWQSLRPLQMTPQSMKFALPKLAPGVFTYRLHATGTIGPVSLVNGPDVWFTQGDHGGAVSPGGRLGVFGTGLGIPAGSSAYPARIALVRNGAVAATVLADAVVPLEASFSAWFTLPPTLAPGQYSLYYHNGFGGPSAWAKYSGFGEGPAIFSTYQTIDTITVATPPVWPTALCAVGAPKGNGAGDDDAFTAAFKAAQGGAVILLSPGTYTLSGTYAQGFGNIMPSHCILRGAGMSGSNASVLSFPQMTGANGPLLGGLPKYVPIPPPWGTTGNQYTQGLFAVENLAVDAPKVTGGAGFTFSYLALGDSLWAPYVDHVKMNMGQPASTKSNGITVLQMSNVRITNCAIAAGFPVIINTRAFGCLVQNNTFTWYQMGMAAGHHAQNTVITGNTFIFPDLPANGVTLGIPAVNRDLYFGGNTTRQLGTGSFWGLSFDEGHGIYFGYAASSQGSTLTLAKAVTPYGYMGPEGSTVMIVAGTGAGQLRYVVASPSTTTITLDRPLEVAADSTSVVSIVCTIGRALFVNNNYGADADDNAFFPSADVIQANNRMTGRSNLLIEQTGKYMRPTGIMNGWHFQLLGNSISNGDGGLASQAYATGFGTGETNAWYTGGISHTNIFRNNVFSAGVTGLIQMSGPMGNGLMENNRGPRFQIQGAKVTDTLLRGNRASDGGVAVIDNQSPAGTVVLP
jgi:hypothetical protein